MACNEQAFRDACRRKTMMYTELPSVRDTLARGFHTYIVQPAWGLVRAYHGHFGDRPTSL